MTTGALPAGHLLAGRYEVLSPLGKGGMGVVYKAHDRVLNETVAIKVLREDVAASAEMGQRFLAEIKLARRVSHRNVCRIHEYGQDGELRYISMAYVDGVDVRQVVREQGPLPPARAFEVAISVADGLEAIHDEGIIHRDLKTSNLMMDTRGQVRLMDFGIAKQHSEQASTGLTATGMVVGTPEYMSPEQVRGQKLDFRSDLYALGVVVHELFTGHTLFPGETPVSLLMKHLQEPPRLDSPALPPAVVPVLERSLAKDRELRYASAREMADALRAARTTSLDAGRPAVADRPTRPTSAVPPPDTVRPAITAAPASTTARVVVAAAPTVPLPTVPPPAPTRAATAPAAAPPPTPTPAPRPWLGPAIGAVGLLALVLAAVVVLRRTPPETVTAPSASPPAVSPTTAPSAGAAALPAATVPAPASPTPLSPAPRERAPAVATHPSAGTPPRLSPEVTMEVEGLLAEAETAFKAQHHRVALEFYEQALALDPANARARIGRDLCAGALAQTPAAAVRPPRTFVAGRTQHSGGAAAPAGPAGFDSSTGVAVRRVDQGAAAPGKLLFEVEPAVVKPGDAYTVKVFMMNEGAAVLRLADATVTTVTDGRPAAGPVALLAREAPPRQRTLLVSAASQWRAEVESWSLAVVVRTANGETYRNELAWK